MVQETAIAEGTDVMWPDEANDSITDLEQVGAHINNLDHACTSTSSSGGTKRIRSRRSRRSRKSRKSSRRRRSRRFRINKSRRIRIRINKRRRSRKMRGGMDELL